VSALPSLAEAPPIAHRVVQRPATGRTAWMARASLYVLTALLTGRVQEVFHFLTPMRAVLIVGLACVISALLTSPPSRQPVLSQREVRTILGLGGLALLMLPFGVWPGGSLNILLNTYSKLAVFCILIVALATHPRIIRNLAVAVLVGMGLLGIFTIAGRTALIAVSPAESAVSRAYASFTYDPNDDAMMMVTTLPLAVLGAAASRGASRIGAAGVAAILTLATIKTVSRGGFIGLAFVTLLLLLRLRSAGTRLLAVVSIVAVLAVAPPTYWNMMGTIWHPQAASTGYEERGILTRLEVWNQGLGILLSKPITGVGIGMYENASWLMYGRGWWLTAHNSFLQIATELGIIGFALFVTLLVFSIKNARRAVWAARTDPRLRELGWVAAAVEISLYTYIVVGFALSQAYAMILYFLVGLAAALRIQVERCRGR
jgi:O-antigen ligase